MIMLVDLSGDLLFDEIKFGIDDFFNGMVIRLMKLFGRNIDFGLYIFRSVIRIKIEFFVNKFVSGCSVGDVGGFHTE